VFTELNSQLSDARQAQRRRNKLRADLRRAQDDLQRARARLAELQAITDQEDRDVRRLEGLSMTALFLTILGSKEEQLQKERQEYLSAHLKSLQSQHAVQTLEGEVERLNYELRRLGDADARLQTLLEKKEALLAQAGDATARQLAKLSEQIGDVQTQLKELAEAIAAGQAARSGIDKVLDDLQSAQGWGVWDLLGGDLLATAIKHNRIDDARQAVVAVQDALGRFQRELADVEQTAQFIVEDIGQFETFADYFFDGLIIDWVVQSRIDRSLDNARATALRLDDLLAQLEARKTALQDQMNRLEESKSSLVERAS
jgi:DNA repair exonuclease SbcCD ATPase subunit